MNQQIQFEEEKRGYKKSQVNEYIETLSGEYRQAFEEIQTLKDKNEVQKEELTEIRRQLRTAERNAVAEKKAAAEQKPAAEQNSQAISSAIIRAEVLAKEILMEAEKEAQKVKRDSKRELEELHTMKQQAALKLKHINSEIALFLKELE